MKNKNLLKKLTAVAMTATMLFATTAFSVSATDADETIATIDDNATSSTQPTDENPANNLVYKTVCDLDTGVTIAGYMPESPEFDIRIRMWDSEIINDNEEPHKFSDKMFSTPTYEDHINNNFNSNGNFYDEDWINPNYLADACAYIPQIDIVFFDDDKVLDLKSNLTVTLPIDYRKFAGVKGSDQNVMVFKSYPEENTIKGLKVLSPTDSPADTVVFKTDSTGTFFLGNEEYMNQFLRYFNTSLENVEVYENTEEPENTEPTDTPEATNPTEDTTDSEEATEKATEKATDKATEDKVSPNTGNNIPASVMIVALGVLLIVIALTVLEFKRKRNK